MMRPTSSLVSFAEAYPERWSSWRFLFGPLEEDTLVNLIRALPGMVDIWDFRCHMSTPCEAANRQDF